MTDLLAIIMAAGAAWILGAVYYMMLAKPWVSLAGIAVDEAGKPRNQSATPFILSAIALVVVAGMTRHMFEMAGIHDIGKGMLSGLGIGAFIVTPWMAINNGYEQRPAMLTVINGGYALIACAAIGGVLGLMT